MKESQIKRSLDIFRELMEHRKVFGKNQSLVVVVLPPVVKIVVDSADVFETEWLVVIVPLEETQEHVYVIAVVEICCQVHEREQNLAEIVLYYCEHCNSKQQNENGYQPLHICHRVVVSEPYARESSKRKVHQNDNVG